MTASVRQDRPCRRGARRPRWGPAGESVGVTVRRRPRHRSEPHAKPSGGVPGPAVDRNPVSRDARRPTGHGDRRRRGRPTPRRTDQRGIPVPTRTWIPDPPLPADRPHDRLVPARRPDRRPGRRLRRRFGGCRGSVPLIPPPRRRPGRPRSGQTIGGGLAPCGGDAPPRIGRGRGTELLAIAVDPGEQGSGIGGALVDSFLAEVGRRGGRSAFVVVASRNDGAVRLYERGGFVYGDRVELHAGTSSLLLQWDRPEDGPEDGPDVGGDEAGGGR